MNLKEFKKFANKEINDYINPRHFFKNRLHVNEANKLLKEINDCKLKDEAKFVLDSFINSYDGSDAITEYATSRETQVLFNQPKQFQQHTLPRSQKYKKKNGDFYKLLFELKNVLLVEVEAELSPIRREINRDKAHSAIKAVNSNPDSPTLTRYRKHLSKITPLSNVLNGIPLACGIPDEILDISDCYDDQFVSAAYYSYTFTEDRSAFKDLKNYVLLPFLKSVLSVLECIKDKKTIKDYITNPKQTNSPLFFYYSINESLELIRNNKFSYFLDNYPISLVSNLYKEILSVVEQAKSYEDYFNLGSILRGNVISVFTKYKNESQLIDRNNRESYTNLSPRSRSHSVSRFEEEKKESYWKNK
ncbi:hypothetical protein [Allofrancisella frigidaquae]|uniref:Uncharacterized protein n=1 Tax=Allofrancisella frigidaquae TaxID=1085644 RepID=A0A6M3HU01_9GAMM|nr:hypothetical protein [Allofrancisella frigidaquae]QIV94567.1 hypothetical protein E3E15_04020 [Allofrancisella frigidaquae]